MFVRERSDSAQTSSLIAGHHQEFPPDIKENECEKVVCAQGEILPGTPCDC